MYSKSTFSAASYAVFRPSYPTSLYNAVLAYHRGRKQLCLDLGCGTGIVSREMASRFDRVIGSDPSTGMIKQARSQTTLSNVEFREGSAESSPFLENDSVDCIVAGQAAHWFDYKKLWPELQRLLRKGGTVALWGYKDPVFVDYPKASEILDHHTYGPDPETCMGPYWEPGRYHVRNQLRIIQPPDGEWEDVERVEYEPACKGRNSGEGTLFMERGVSVAQTKDYLRTYSSYSAWQEKHPDQMARNKGGKGDLMDRMFDEMAEQEDVFKDEENVVQMEWGSALVMCRKK